MRAILRAVFRLLSVRADDAPFSCLEEGAFEAGTFCGSRAYSRSKICSGEKGRADSCQEDRLDFERFVRHNHTGTFPRKAGRQIPKGQAQSVIGRGRRYSPTSVRLPHIDT